MQLDELTQAAEQLSQETKVVAGASDLVAPLASLGGKPSPLV